MADHETYYELRDGPREQRARWCIMKLRRYLSPDQVRLAELLQAMHDEVHSTPTAALWADRVDGGGNHRHDQMILRRSDVTLVLAAYEKRAAQSMHGPKVFEAIIAGDTLVQLSRRLGMSTRSPRAVRRAVQITLNDLADLRREMFDASRRASP